MKAYTTTLLLQALAVALLIPSGIQAQPRPEQGAPRTNTATSLLDAGQQWAGFVDELAGPGGYSGGIHLSRGEEVILEQFWGRPDRNSDAVFNRDTRFNIASMGKMFTAVAVGQLVDGGLLSWDDTVGQHYPEFPWEEYADQITVEQLLSHQSGLGNYAFDHGLADVEAIVEHASGQPLAFEPGDRMGYSNTGFAVLGVIIERASGMNYYEYIRTHVFERVGMTGSGFFSALEPVGNMALGYTAMGPDGQRVEGERQPNAGRIEPIGSPGGGAYATLRDLQQFASALLNDELITRSTRDELWRGRVLMGGSTYYALGFGTRVSGGLRVLGHNGGAPGIGAVLQLFPDLGVTAIAFTNHDPMPIVPMTREIVRLIASIPE